MWLGAQVATEKGLGSSGQSRDRTNSYSKKQTQAFLYRKSLAIRVSNADGWINQVVKEREPYRAELAPPRAAVGGLYTIVMNI
jgi:hypothetical protein